MVKGDHDNPEQMLLLRFLDAPLEVQLAFHQEALDQARPMFELELLANERSRAQCPWTCEDFGSTWSEGIYATDLVVEYDGVLDRDRSRGRLHWTTDAYASARVGCGCGCD